MLDGHPDRLGLARRRLLVAGRHDVEHQPDGEDRRRSRSARSGSTGCACGRRPSGRSWRSSWVSWPRRQGYRRRVRQRPRSGCGSDAPAAPRSISAIAVALPPPSGEEVGEGVDQRTELAAGRPVTPRRASASAYWRALVAQRVEARRDHQRGRQPGQVVGQQRRDPRIGRRRRPIRRGIVAAEVHVRRCRKNPSANSVLRPRVGRAKLVTGYSSSCSAGAGTPSSRASWDTTAARLPPALSPPTATRLGSAPSSAACSRAQRIGGVGVVDGGGRLVLGRQPVVDGQHVHAGVAADHLGTAASWVSRSPTTKPPPWKKTSSGASASFGPVVTRRDVAGRTRQRQVRRRSTSTSDIGETARPQRRAACARVRRRRWGPAPRCPTARCAASIKLQAWGPGCCRRWSPTVRRSSSRLTRSGIRGMAVQRSASPATSSAPCSRAPGLGVDALASAEVTDRAGRLRVMVTSTVLIRWHLQLGNIVIPKSVNPEELRVISTCSTSSATSRTWRPSRRSMDDTRLGPDPRTFNFTG